MDARLATGDEFYALYQQALSELGPARGAWTRARIEGTVGAIRLLRALHAIGLLRRPDVRPVEMPFAVTDGIRGDGGFFLSDDELAAFERDGFTAPFDVLPHDEALAFGKKLQTDLMQGPIVYGAFPGLEGEERAAALAKSGIREDWESRGWNRHHDLPELMALYRRPEITDRLASILGEKIVLWRSQTFPVAPGNPGSFLHQVTTFEHGTTGRELVPTREMNDGLINVSVWIALTDVDETNAAMVMVPGSHTNDAWQRAASNAVYLASQLDTETLRKVVTIRTVANSPFARFDAASVFYEGLGQLGLVPKIDPSEAVTLKMRAGQAVIFTSKCVHGSHRNQGTNHRFAVAGRYCGAHVDLYPDPGDYYEIQHFLPLKPKLVKEWLKGVVVRP